MQNCNIVFGQKDSSKASQQDITIPDDIEITDTLLAQVRQYS